MFVPPMLLHKQAEPFDDSHYIFQPKINGQRLIYAKEDGQLTLFSKHGIDLTDRFPELSSVPIEADSVLLDGEIAVKNPDSGRIDYELLQMRYRITKPSDVRAAMRRWPVTYYPFDLLRCRGQDLRRRPLEERIALLEQLLPEQDSYVSRLPSIDTYGKQLFQYILNEDHEGMVAKRKNSVYTRRKSSSWLKIMRDRKIDVVITGIRKHRFGWRMGIAGQDGVVADAGCLEDGISDVEKKAFAAMIQPIVTGEDRSYRYIKPVVACQVTAKGVTAGGMLRSPEFIGFVLHDKKL